MVKDVEVKSILTKSNLPVADYSVNPYVGCAHGYKYCYASFNGLSNIKSLVKALLM